jgi:predicted HD phosphohydrolase
LIIGVSFQWAESERIRRPGHAAQGAAAIWAAGTKTAMLVANAFIPWQERSTGAYDMSKEQRSIKEAKKKPAMTLKEKKAAKKSKKEARNSAGIDKTR